eukprot:3151909-Rhodomonas_salina.2
MCPRPTVLCLCYTMSGTKCSYATTRCASEPRQVAPASQCGTCLRACYAMRGTNLEHIVIPALAAAVGNARH